MPDVAVPIERSSGVPDAREAAVPARLPDAVVRGPLVEAAPGAVLVRVPMVGRFLVRAGAPTLVEPAAGATDADLRCFRDEVVAAAAALLNGGLPLRAASVSIGGRAVAVCGPSAAGKSALAAALAQRGHAMLADAVTVVAREHEADSASVGPLAPEAVLWPDTVEDLGLRAEPSRRVRPALSKRAYRLGSGATPARSPLAAVVVVRPEPSLREPELEPVTGAGKLRALLAARWHQRLVEPLGYAPRQFNILASIAALTPCLRLRRPSRGAPPAVLAELVEELLA